MVNDAPSVPIQSAVPEKRRRLRKCIDFALIAILVLAVLKTNCRLERYVDRDGTDETGYVALGLAVPREGLPDPSKEVFFAPLYSLWYLALAQIQPDPSRLVDLNFRILSVALAVACYGLLRCVGCNVVASAGGTFFLICHRLSLEPSTRSVHFALLLLVLGMWAAASVQGSVRRGALLSLGATGAAFVRPEFALLAIAMLGVTGFAAWRKRKLLLRPDWVSFGVAVLTALGLIAVLGAPVGAGNNRSWVAFSQHFALNHLARHPSDLDPWLDAYAVTTKVFGVSATISDAFRANPGAFSEHVMINLHALTRQLPRTLIAHRNFLFPDGHRMQLLENAALIAGFLGVSFAMRHTLIGNLRSALREHWSIALFGAAVIAITFAGMLLTSVAERYLFPSVFVSLIVPCVALGYAKGIEENYSAPSLWVCGVGLFGLAPAPPYSQQSPTPVRTALEALWRLRIQGKTGYVEALAMEGFDIYLPPKVRFVHLVEKTSGFREFLATHEVGVFHMTPYLSGARQFSSDPEWDAFMSNPAHFGFSVLPLPFSEALYVRQDLIPP